jgi:hypothetical protein
MKHNNNNSSSNKNNNNGKNAAPISGTHAILKSLLVNDTGDRTWEGLVPVRTAVLSVIKTSYNRKVINIA